MIKIAVRRSLEKIIAIQRSHEIKILQDKDNAGLKSRKARITQHRSFLNYDETPNQRKSKIWQEKNLARQESRKTRISQNKISQGKNLVRPKSRNAKTS